MKRDSIKLLLAITLVAGACVSSGYTGSEIGQSVGRSEQKANALSSILKLNSQIDTLKIQYAVCLDAVGYHTMMRELGLEEETDELS